MKKLCFWLAVCLVLTALQGCTTSPVRPETNAVYGREQRAAGWLNRDRYSDDELLIYVKRFGDLSAEEQKKEFLQVTQALNRDRKDILNRLKAALVYGLPASRHRDTARARTLLSELQREKGLDENVAALVAILKEYLDDRQKLEENATALAQKAKDEQRRADDLQRKLDALKNIEKTMIERSRGNQ